MKNLASEINLGIDAKWFFSGPPSGKVVVKNLVDEMIKHNDNRFKLFLLLTNKWREQALSYFPASVGLIFLPDNIPNLLSNSLLVPIAAFRYNLHIVLFQNFICTWPKKLCKIAYIHDVLFLDHPNYYSRPELIYFKQMKNLAVKADQVITISGTEKKRLIDNNLVEEGRIKVVYHGINDGFKPIFKCDEEEVRKVVNKYDLPGRYLLFVSRMNIRKNLKNLTKAIDLLDDKCIKLLIVGEKNKLSADLEKFIDSKELSGRIIFTGHVPEKDLQLIYACATVFCFPSFAEGFGLPPLEAMKCGVPVVVSDREAMPEVCGNAAVYFDPHSPSDIASKINSLLDDQKFYNEKVEKGLDRAREFVWARSAKQIFTLIEETYAR